MSNVPDEDIQQLLRDAYEAFNRRDVDRALASMNPDVDWANGWEGGYVHGHDAVREYWTRQWKELDPVVVPGRMRVGDDGRVVVTVDQQVRGLDGELLGAGEVLHVYTLRDGRVARMEIIET